MTTAETPTRTPTEYPHIERDHKGRPVIKGTRMRVSMVVQYVYGVNRYTPEQMVDNFKELLDLSKVYQALAFYHAHREEIDRVITLERTYAEEMSTRPEAIATNERTVAKMKQYLKDHPHALPDNELANEMRREML